MDRQLPPQIVEDISKGKRLFPIESPDGYLYDCKNCGGLGKIGAFYVKQGPYQYVPPLPDKTEILKSFPDSQYGWLWYRGIDLFYECPVCDGIGSTERKKAPMSFREYEAMDKTRIEAAIKNLSLKMGRKHQLTGSKERGRGTSSGKVRDGERADERSLESISDSDTPALVQVDERVSEEIAI